MGKKPNLLLNQTSHPAPVISYRIDTSFMTMTSHYINIPQIKSCIHKGLVINYEEGGKRWENRGSKTFEPRHLKTG